MKHIDLRASDRFGCVGTACMMVDAVRTPHLHPLEQICMNKHTQGKLHQNGNSLTVMHNTDPSMEKNNGVTFLPATKIGQGCIATAAQTLKVPYIAHGPRGCQ